MVTAEKRVSEILKNADCNTISYGFNDEDLTAEDISFDNRGCASFSVCKNGDKLFKLTLNNPGKHNILNALSSIAVGLIFKVPNEAIIAGLEKCKGAHKRFEFKGEKDGITVIDDYAHHPTEIKAT